MLIKAGTYRFNDVLTMPIVDGEQTINFSVDVDWSFWGTKLQCLAYCDSMVFHPNSTDLFNYVIVASEPADIGLSYPMTLQVYFELGGWDDAFAESIQTITIPTDQEVSAEFLTWFTANAVADGVQISGKWKFKDVLTAPNFQSDESVNFTANYSYAGYVGTVLCNGLKLVEGDEFSWRIRSTLNSLSDPNFQVLAENVLGVSFPFESAIYTEYNNGETGYNFASYGFDFQTIDFGTEPQTVSAEFYEWLTANASQPCASITHNGEEIASLFPGQTATLKCKGMKMEDDVVVAVGELPETEIPEPKLQEKTATENGEVLPDEGYDGLSKVTVTVEATAPIEDYDGTITIV